MISYKDSLINAWTKNDNSISIHDLRKVYFDVYFENHKSKTSIQKEEIRIENLINKLARQSMNYESYHKYYEVNAYRKELENANNEKNPELKLKKLMEIGRSNGSHDGSIYRIVKQYGYRIPMSNGKWKYDPLNAEDYLDDPKAFYFENLSRMVYIAIREWHQSFDKKERYELIVYKPYKYYYGMAIAASIKSNALDIPIKVYLRSKSIGVYNPFTYDTNITFHEDLKDESSMRNAFFDLQKSIEKLEEMYIK